MIEVIRKLWCILRTGRDWHPRMAWVAGDEFHCSDCGMTFNFPKEG